MWLLYWWWCVSKINLPTETRNGERNRMFYGFGETLFTEERAERFLGGVPDEPSPIPSSELDFLFSVLVVDDDLAFWPPRRLHYLFSRHCCPVNWRLYSGTGERCSGMYEL